MATDVIRVSVTPDDGGNHARMLDLLQRLHESSGLNTGEEVLPCHLPLASATPVQGAIQFITSVRLVRQVSSCLAPLT